MPKFTLIMNIFTSISLRHPNKYVLKHSEHGLIFLRQSILGVTCLDLVEKRTFSHLSPEKSHKCVLTPPEQGSFSEMIDLRSHMPRFTLKMNIFTSFS